MATCLSIVAAGLVLAAPAWRQWTRAGHTIDTARNLLNHRDDS